MAQRTLERPRVLEGTWEEVTERAGELSGRRVTLTVYPEAAEEAPRNLAELLAPLLEEADRLVPEEPIPHTDPDEIAFGEIMKRKAERLGLKL